MKILIVDDDRPVGKGLKGSLEKLGHEVSFVDNGEEAMKLLKSTMYDLVLLDIMMPDMDGIQLLGKIRQIDPDMTVVMVTGVKEFELVRKSLQLGAFDYIVKPFNPNDMEFMLNRVKERLTILKLKKDYQTFLEEKVYQQTLKVKRIFLGSIASLIKTIEAKDPYHKDHSENVSKLSVEIGKRMGLSKKELNNLSYSGLLHDIGKVGIPDRILLKADKLTPEEYEVIKRHPAIGYEILKPLFENKNILDGVLYHHERYDGTGFPEGLKKEEIPLFGRIIGVADAIEAMTAERPYRAKLSREEVIGELERNSGKQFDPYIAKIGIKIMEDRNG